MQTILRQEVAKLISTSGLPMKAIATQCNVSLMTAYNVKSRLAKGEKIEHKPGADPKFKITQSHKISLSLTVNNPRMSLRSMATT